GSAANMAISIRTVSPPRATTLHQARPICCGRTVMSPRVSSTPRAPPSMRRWRAPRVLRERAMGMPLSTNSNFAKPDYAFRAVVEAHRGLSEEQSADLDAALVLILANHIGDLGVLREAIELGKRRVLDASQQQQQQQ